MLLSRLKWLAVVVVAILLLGAGAGIWVLANQDAQPDANPAGPLDAGARPEPKQNPNQAGNPKGKQPGVVQLGSPNWRYSAHVNGLAYANDGKWLVIAEGPFIRVLDANTGQELSSFKAQPYHINSMSVAGDKVVVTGGDRQSHIWDFRQGKKLLTFPAHKNGSRHICMSPDGKYVAATGDDVGRKESLYVSSDYSVRVWDATTGKELAPFAGGLKTGLCGTFSPDGKLFAWGGHGLVRLYRLTDGKELFQYKCKSDYVHDLAFSSDSKLLACGARGELPLLDTKTGQARFVCVRKGFPVVGDSNWRVGFSPQGDTVAACSEGGIIDLWDPATGTPQGQLSFWPPGSPSAWIGAITFSPDGKTLASAPQDQTIRLWDLATRKQKNGLIENQPVRGVLITPDGKTVISKHTDGKLRWWDVAAGKEVHVETRPTGAPLFALSTDGKKFYTLEDSKLLRWDIATRKPAVVPLPPLKEGGTCMALSPDGNVLASGSLSGSITLQDLQSGQSIKLDGHKGEVTALAFTPDSKFLLSASGAVTPAKPLSDPEWDKTIRLWDVRKGKEIRVVGKVPNPAHSLAVSPDGKLVVSNAVASDWTGMPMWEIATGKEARRLGPYDGHPSQVAFAPNGKWLAIARWQIFQDTQGTVVVLDTRTWKEIKSLPGHVHRITSLAFTPDSKYLVTGSEDSTANVWNLAELVK